MAAFTVAPAPEGSATAFAGSASNAASGSLADYAWVFGDGTTANTLAPMTTHTYASAGPFTATPTVTDTTGAPSPPASRAFSIPPGPAVVTGISPSIGPVPGGTVVTITGTGFVVGSTTAAFGLTAETSVSCSTTTTCTATSPAGVAGTVDVTVTTVGGTSATSAADQFTYVPAPTISGATPSAGPLAGGTVVTITGTNFSGVTGVSFGALAAPTIAVNSATQLSATSPAGVAGVVDLTVTTPGGPSTTNAFDKFTHDAVPAISSISPTAGGTGGGDVVTITGTGFVPGSTSAHFGLVAASALSCASTTTCSATSPAQGAGLVGITVTTPGGTSAAVPAAEFTFATTSGVRTATLEGSIAVPAVNASHSNEDATDQPASIEVDDLTGTDAGWDVTLVASDLAGPNGGTIAAGNLSVAGYGGLASVSGATTGIQPGNTGSIGSATTLLSGPPGPVRATTSKRSTWV